MLKDQFVQAGLAEAEALALANTIAEGGLAETVWTEICASFLSPSIPFEVHQVAHKDDKI